MADKQNKLVVSRRTVAQGAAWTVPTVALASVAPAAAATNSAVTVQTGMFNTVVGSGYGYDDVARRGATQVRQSSSDGYTGSPTDRSWSDATGYPTVPINRSSGVNVMNFEGSYTPTGTTTGSVDNYYGSGMWLSSPMETKPDGTVAPAAGCTTLAAGAVFTMDYKIVATQRSQAQFRTESGWGSASTLDADSTGNIGGGGQRVATNGVSESLSWSTWSIGTTTWRLSNGTSKTLYVGTGTLTMTTTADLTVCSGGTDANPTVQYTQLMLTPGMLSVAGLGNGTMLYCSTLSYQSGSITTTVDGSTTEAVAVLDPVTSYVRSQYDYGYNGDRATQYTGTC